MAKSPRQPPVPRESDGPRGPFSDAVPIGLGTRRAVAAGGREVVLKPLDEACVFDKAIHPSIKLRLQRVQELPSPVLASLIGVWRDRRDIVLAWQWLDGPSLEELAEDPTTSDAELIRVVRDAALALGYAVVLVEQPYRVAGKKAAAPAAQLDAAWTSVIEQLAKRRIKGLPLIVGGRSSGARVACRTAAATGAAGVLSGGDEKDTHLAAGVGEVGVVTAEDGG